MRAPQPLDQPLHLRPGERVERAERFVEQQQAGMMHERARQRHALLLPARQHARPFLGTVRQPDVPQRGQRCRAPVAAARDADIGDHPLPGEQPRILEHDRGGGRQTLHSRAVQRHRPSVGGFEAGEQPQQRAFAFAAATHDADEGTRIDREVEAGEHDAAAERLGDLPKLHPDASGRARQRDGRRRGGRARRFGACQQQWRVHVHVATPCW